MEITELEKAYLAGLFDGEGTVSVSRQGGYKGQRYPHIHTAIYNTNRSVLEWVDSKWPGRVISHAGWMTVKSKVVYAYIPSSNMMIDFFNDMLPYLQIKRNQVKLAIEFRELVEKTKLAHRPGKARSNLYVANLPRRNQIAILISTLNRRGRLDNVEIA